jgi:hypothetical protein
LQLFIDALVLQHQEKINKINPPEKVPVMNHGWRGTAVVKHTYHRVCVRERRSRRGIFTQSLRFLTLRKYSTALSRQEMYSLTMRWTKTVSFDLHNSLERF